MGRALELEELRREVDALKRGEPMKDVTNEIKAFERDLKAVEQSTRGELARRPAIGGPSTPARPPVGPAAVASTQAPAKAASTVAAAKVDAPAPTPVEDEPREERKVSGT
jgi:hypothetical protein